MNFSTISFCVVVSSAVAISFLECPYLGAQETGGVNFATDIWPILQDRCISCHNADRAEGNLRFDAGRAGVEKGGHTGRAILGSPSSDSALVARINSTEAGFRMPKQGPPLKGTQIAALTAWVEAGAPWPDGVGASKCLSPQRQQTNTWQTLADGLVWFEGRMKHRGFRGLFYLSIVSFVTALMMFWGFRRSEAYEKSRAQSQSAILLPAWSRRLNRMKTVAIVVLFFFCIATYIHYDAKHKDAVEKITALNAELLTYTGPPQRSSSLSPPHPLHPPRLGGVYYRGNDERDPRLFNGGFYRTAQLEVWLTDVGGNRLKWGDLVTGDLFIDFEIKRSANTTSALFTDHIMSVIGLSDNFRLGDGLQGRPMVEGVLPMRTIHQDQWWRCRYPIDRSNDPPKATGKVFVVQNTSKPKAHYAIQFDIKFDAENRIADTSQLWMGSLYNLNGRVFVPYNSQKILLDRWFDWREIPEITGPQTDDPGLLGVPEHR